MTEHVWVLEGDSCRLSPCDKNIVLCGGHMYVAASRHQVPAVHGGEEGAGA